MDGPSELFELASLSYLNKGIDQRAANNCKPEFDKITRNLQDKVTKLSCEVNEMDVKLQKQINDFLTQCQTIDENVSVVFPIPKTDFFIKTNSVIFSQVITSVFFRDMVISGFEISIIIFSSVFRSIIVRLGKFKYLHEE